MKSWDYHPPQPAAAPTADEQKEENEFQRSISPSSPPFRSSPSSPSSSSSEKIIPKATTTQQQAIILEEEEEEEEEKDGGTKTATVAGSVLFYEDAKRKNLKLGKTGKKGQKVSLSSVDSEPVAPNFRRGARKKGSRASSRASSICSSGDGHDSIFMSSEEDDEGDDEGEGGGGEWKRRRDTLERNMKDGVAKWRTAVEEVDLKEFVEPIAPKPLVAEEERGNATNTTTADGAIANEDYVAQAEVAAEVLPLERISPMAAAVIDGVIVRSSTVVASKCSSSTTPVVDSGTVLCFPPGDGTVLGPVASLLGPVVSCSYAIIVPDGALFAKLLAEGKLAEGNLLHFDVKRCSVIFDPSLISGADGHTTDASFVNDDELPENARPDFSDDEKEKEWKRDRKMRGRAVAAALQSAAVVEEAEGAVSDVSEGSEYDFDEEGRIVGVKRERGQPPSAAAVAACSGGRGRGRFQRAPQIQLPPPAAQYQPQVFRAPQWLGGNPNSAMQPANYHQQQQQFSSQQCAAVRQPSVADESAAPKKKLFRYQPPSSVQQPTPMEAAAASATTTTTTPNVVKVIRVVPIGLQSKKQDDL